MRRSPVGAFEICEARSSTEPTLHCPALFLTRLRLASSRLIRLTSSRPRHSELSRSDATTDAACRAGS